MFFQATDIVVTAILNVPPMPSAAMVFAPAKTNTLYVLTSALISVRMNRTVAIVVLPVVLVKLALMEFVLK